jgi:hypothetical protein
VIDGPNSVPQASPADSCSPTRSCWLASGAVRTLSKMIEAPERASWNVKTAPLLVSTPV